MVTDPARLLCLPSSYGVPSPSRLRILDFLASWLLDGISRAKRLPRFIPTPDRCAFAEMDAAEPAVDAVGVYVVFLPGQDRSPEIS